MKLMLDNRRDNGYPSVFEKADVTLPAGEDRRAWFEERILAALNRYNPRLQVTEVVYGDIRARFPSARAGITSGVIYQEREIAFEEMENYRIRGYASWVEGGSFIAGRIRAYVYMPLPAVQGKSEGRNTLVAQTLFPTLIDYMGEYLDSPGYEPANHPVFFVNVRTQEISASSTRKDLASLALVGIRYVDVFGEERRRPLYLEEVPGELREFLMQYDERFQANYDQGAERYENPYLRIFFREKRLIIKSDAAVEKLVFKEGLYDFGGSGEKFYWMNIYPMAIAAYEQGYQVDITAYREFVEYYEARFSPYSEKMARCRTLLLYFEKYMV